MNSTKRTSKKPKRRTRNQELKLKIEELALANNNLQNVINSTDIGTIFLDRALKVKLFTARTRDIFNLLPADVGRPLSNPVMFKIWRVLPDGRYEQLDEREVILTEMRFTLEDSRAMADAFCQIHSDTADMPQR